MSGQMPGVPQAPQPMQGMRPQMPGMQPGRPMGAGQPFNAPMPMGNSQAFKGGMQGMPSMQGLPPFQGGGMPSQPSTGQFMQQYQQQRQAPTYPGAPFVMGNAGLPGNMGSDSGGG